MDADDVSKLKEEQDKPTVFHFKSKPLEDNHSSPNQHENQSHIKGRSAIKKKEKKPFERNRKVQIQEETPVEEVTVEQPQEVAQEPTPTST